VPLHLHVLERIWSHARAGCSVLDVSIGWGFVARVLARNGLSVVGVDSTDISGDMWGRFEDADIPLVDVKIEEQDLPFPDDHFDIVYWGATIEHLHNSPRRPMVEMFRVLKPGGIFIIDTPNILSLKKRLLMLCGKSFMPSLRYVWNAPFHGEHHREYTLAEVVSACEWTGYDVVEARFLETFFPMSLRRLGKLYVDRADPMAERSVQDVGFHWKGWYDWAKLPLWALVTVVPSLRDTLLVVARKP
jgi:SAM-dependent methyltransferase